MDRRQFLTASGLALGGLLAGGLWRPRAALPAPPAAGWDTAAYWAFIDRVQARMDALWSEQAGAYQPPQSMVQANMLLTHAVAALPGTRARRGATTAPRGSPTSSASRRGSRRPPPRRATSITCRAGSTAPSSTS